MKEEFVSQSEALPTKERWRIESDTEDERKQFCNRLVAAWNRCPSMRFGQLVSNACASESDRDLFYVDDEEFIKMIETFTGQSLYCVPKERNL